MSARNLGARLLRGLAHAAAWASLSFFAVHAQTVTTDKPDYNPGETALITATGFHASELVTLQVVHESESPCQCTSPTGHLPWDALADANGVVQTTWYVDPIDSYGATFLLTADCAHGLHAEHVFTDALGQARVTSVLPLDGGCVQQNLPPTGVENWYVQQDHAYLVTLSNVVDCLDGLSPTMQVILASDDTGDQCITAQLVSTGVYSFVVTMPVTACNSYSVQYCTTNCVAGGPSSSNTKFARRSDGAPQQSRLRAGTFQAGCTNPTPDENCFCPPIVLTCPADIVLCADPDTCCQTAFFDPTLSGGCPNATVVANPPSGACFPIGTTTVFVDAQDGTSTAQCSFTVTVTDCAGPKISCPPDITQCNDAGECGAVVSFVASAIDSCSGPALVVCTPPSGSFFPVGDTEVTCTATDTAGNSSVCMFTVTVTDCEEPTITCPPEITQCNDLGQCCAVVNFSLSADDNCPDSVVQANPPSGSCFPVGQTTVQCTVTDAAGNTANCSFTVTVQDCEAPALNLPFDVTLCNDSGACCAAYDFSASTTDNCPGAIVQCVPPSGTCFPIGVTTVQCSATDAAGNVTNGTFTVTVNDCEDPTISCPAAITQCNDGGECCSVVNFSVTALDNCPGVSVTSTPPSGSCFPVGTTTVQCTATDAGGRQATCSFDVTVTDCEAPTIACPANVDVCNDAGLCCAVVDFTVTAGDNCAGATVVSNPPSGTCFPVGQTTVQCTATDAAGNVANCSFEVVVRDCEPPTIHCPPNFIETWTTGPPAQVDPSHTGFATYGDNCSAVLTYSDVFHPGMNPGEPETIVTRTWTVTDGAGRTASCEQTITLLSPGNHGGMHLDLSPGSCPNAVGVWSGVPLQGALIGSFQFDVGQVMPGTLRLMRADGQGRALKTHLNSYEDVASPYHGAIGGCHTLGADGEVDLCFSVLNSKVRRAFLLLNVPNGTVLPVKLFGKLYDGSVFQVNDSILVLH